MAPSTPRPALAFVLGILALGGIPAAVLATTGEDTRFERHRFVSADGHESIDVLRRPADASDPAERSDPGYGPDGWIQATPRESFRGVGVPLPLAPDWVGTRVRAVGALAWYDVDGDGDLDLFVGTYSANSYPPIEDYYNFAYLNVGGVLENEPSWIAAFERHTGDLAVGDVNGDGREDIVVGNGGGSLQSTEVFYGQGGLLATVPSWSSADNTWTIGIALADYDRDGDLDLATANQGRTSDPYRPTQLFQNTGSGLDPFPVWSSQQVGITNAADFADFDGDGDLDLAVSGWANWQTGVFRNNSGSGLETTFAWTTGDPAETDKGIGWSDVDGNGDPDLGVGGNGNPDRWYRNDDGALQMTPEWQSQESYNGCQELVWVDLDRDGDDDLATVHFGNGHTRIYLNTDGILSATPDWIYDASSSASAIAFGDMNGDGALELAIGVANGPVEVFYGEIDPASVPDLGADGGGSLSGEELRLVAVPNPAQREFTLRVAASLEGRGSVRAEGSRAGRVRDLRLIDVSGRAVADYGTRSMGEVLEIPVGTTGGVYLLEGRLVGNLGEEEPFRTRLTVR